METPDGQMGDPALPIADTLIPVFSELQDGYVCWHPEYDPQNPPDDTGPSGYIDVTRMLERPNQIDAKTDGMLDAFIQLRDGEGILRFVRTFGPLHLCSDGLPLTELHPGLELDCIPHDWPYCLWPEKLDHWLKFVRRAKAILGIAAALHQEEKGDSVDWALLEYSIKPAGGYRINLKDMSRESLRTQRQNLAWRIEDWLNHGDISQSFTWPDRGPSFGFVGSTFGVLGLQLMFAVSKGQRMTICDGCGGAYTRDRKPTRGKRNYCTACKDGGVDKRDRKRRQRAREQEENNG